MLRFGIHYGFHIVVPIIIALLFYKKSFSKSLFILIGIGFLIDLDHLFASPVYMSSRCSINFHPLHSYIAILVYLVLFALKKTRIFGLAWLLHILADSADCYMMYLGY